MRVNVLVSIKYMINIRSYVLPSFGECPSISFFEIYNSCEQLGGTQSALRINLIILNLGCGRTLVKQTNKQTNQKNFKKKLEALPVVLNTLFINI